MILVHPGSTCGSADFNLGIEAGALREALAAEVQAWPHDMMIVYDALSDELEHYAVLGLVIENAKERSGRRVIDEKACDQTGAHWPEIVRSRFTQEWPEGPYKITVTGAWYSDDGSAGCVNSVAQALNGHDIKISPNALRA